VAHGARSFTPGWLADIARIGQGGKDRSCYGVRMMMVINPHGGPRGGRWAVRSAVKRSGANRVGSSHQRGSRCTLLITKVTLDPAGM
jgi:hypothetical protein